MFIDSVTGMQQKYSWTSSVLSKTSLGCVYGGGVDVS